MAVNYASVFSKQVDERFYKESQVARVLNNRYKFNGVKTVTVYTIPTVTMSDYDRPGTNDSTTAFHRYGTPTNLGNTVQNLTISKDRAFTFIIDRADKNQTQMVMDAGQALSRQIREVVIPEYDTYVIRKLATSAKNKDTTAVTNDNAYELFLNAQATISDEMAPDGGRVCLCTYEFYNKLAKLDVLFRKDGDLSQRQLISGYAGEVDGVTMIRVPSSRFPSTGSGASLARASFILTHADAAVAPKQLEDYKIHDNPPGISGWLVEGRIVYDAFVLNNKKGAIFYQGPALS